MTYEWTNNVVLITGAATGIGAGVVPLLLLEGVKFVAVLDIDEEAGVSQQNELTKEYGANRVKFFKCDVTNEELLFGIFNTVIADQGYIDVVINNAGLMNDSVYKKQIDVNLGAVVGSTLKAYELMRKDRAGKGGTVINVSSIAALIQTPLLPVYFGTKSAVLQFSNCMGLPEYYNKSGVRILTICFGATDTTLLSARKLGSFDREIEAEFPTLLKEYPWQTAESAAQGVIDAFKLGDSGSTWLSTTNKPVKDITAAIKKAHDIMSAVIFE